MSATMKIGAGTVVFLGPTMALSDARDILPGATFYPPVAQGDVYSLLGQDQPEAIAIIDGVFYQDLPVWHKEILSALENGIAVYGASSMGALRAAECSTFGMVGVGAIFEGYASGEIMDDDEVAVAHDGPESGWRPRTEPMVNLRATFQRAVSEGRMDQAATTRALQVAKAIWFPERARVNFLQTLEGSGASAEEVQQARAALEHGYVDQKWLDAEALLLKLRDRAAAEGRSQVQVSQSHVFVAFVERDRKVEHEGVTVRMDEIARHAALHEGDYAQLRDRAIDRLLVEQLAELFGVEVSLDEVANEARRIRARLGLLDDQALDRWLRANDVDGEWFDKVARREAAARRLRDWAGVRQGMRRIVSPLLDELRLAGRYVEAASAAATAVELRNRLQPDLSPHEPTGEKAEAWSEAAALDLMRDQIRCSAWRPEVPLVRFAEEAGFGDIGEIIEELAANRAVRAHLKRQIGLLEHVFTDEDRTERNNQASPI